MAKRPALRRLSRKPAKKRAAKKTKKVARAIPRAKDSESRWRPRGIVKAHPEAISSALAGRTIAPGFRPQPRLNVTFEKGRTLANLSFKNFYLGAEKWSPSDMQNIDKALSGAMSDKRLNNVMLQYFPGQSTITTNFLGSTKVNGPVDATYSRDSVNVTLQALMTSGDLTGIDFANTVICLFLPPGIILITDAAGGVGKLKLKGDDDADTSSEGLGGYHGSAHLGATTIYFAVGVYSETVNQRPNGIPVWSASWKNVVATFYHELNEARTDPDVEESERAKNKHLLGWYADVDNGGEIGDMPMNEAGSQLSLIMQEVPLAGGGTAPIQYMWSNAVSGPEAPFG